MDTLIEYTLHVSPKSGMEVTDALYDKLETHITYAIGSWYCDKGYLQKSEDIGCTDHGRELQKQVYKPTVTYLTSFNCWLVSWINLDPLAFDKEGRAVFTIDL